MCAVCVCVVYALKHVHVCMFVYVSKTTPPTPPLSSSLSPSPPLSLSGEGFNMEAGQLFCGGCYGESYGATCGGCGSKIGGDQLWVEALDQQWHSHCFTCTVSECVLFRCVCSTIDT